MPRIAIIGGGISGLSAAFSLEEKRQSGHADGVCAVTNLRPDLGGVLVTDHVDGCLVEAGPDSFLSEKPWAADLCRKIGLGDQLIGSNDADRKTYIVSAEKWSRPTRRHAGWADVHGADKNSADRDVAAVFISHKMRMAARVVSSSEQGRTATKR